MTVDAFLRTIERTRIRRRRIVFGSWTFGAVLLAAALWGADLFDQLLVAAAFSLLAMALVRRRPLSEVADAVDQQLKLPQTLGTFVRCDDATRAYVEVPASVAVERATPRLLVAAIHPAHAAAFIPLLAAFLVVPAANEQPPGNATTHDQISWTSAEAAVVQQNTDSLPVPRPTRPGHSASAASDPAPATIDAGSRQISGNQRGDASSDGSGEARSEVSTVRPSAETGPNEFGGQAGENALHGDGGEGTPSSSGVLLADGEVQSVRPALADETEAAAASATDQEVRDRRVPAAYRDLVRRYFSGD